MRMLPSLAEVKIRFALSMVIPTGCAPLGSVNRILRGPPVLLKTPFRAIVGSEESSIDIKRQVVGVGELTGRWNKRKPHERGLVGRNHANLPIDTGRRSESANKDKAGCSGYDTDGSNSRPQDEHGLIHSATEIRSD
jgi:hypothetical protein